jgi:alpha-1,3/alpha-1,6-mannosyltransferase
MTATDETTAPSSCVQNNNNKKTISIVFVHLDLGIGGAEQLLLQLASASNSCENTDSIQIFTTRCDPQHCFALVKPPDGALYHSVQVRGAWIPHDVFGKFRVVCSTLRVLYLTTIVLCGKQPNVIVVDVLPTPLLLFKYLSPSALLYYCHYPDALLKKSTTTTGTLAAKSKWHTRWYQSIMLRAETAGMTAADVIAVNSQFTETVVHDTFPLLQQDLSVLYPALDASCLSTSNTKTNCILSLNRFERKKNIELVLHGCAWIRKESKHVELPTIVLCGGYDPRNVENVQYQAELQQLACELQLQVEFKLSAADEERAQLLAQSLVVVYTPDREHFGIVPLEAMYSVRTNVFI